jgi:hypothetical protein
MELTFSPDLLYTLKPFPLWLHILRATVFDFEGHSLLWTTVPWVTVQDLIPADCRGTLSDSVPQLNYGLEFQAMGQGAGSGSAQWAIVLDLAPPAMGNRREPALNLIKNRFESGTKQ